MRVRLLIFALLTGLVALFVASPASVSADTSDCSNSVLGLICVSVSNGKATATVAGKPVASVDASGTVREVVKVVPTNVPVPGPVQTVKVPVPTPVPVPGPTKTVYVAGPERIITVTQSPSVGQTATARGTLTASANPTPSPKVVKVTEKVPGKDRTIRVTVPQAVGISIGLLLLGSLVFLGIMYVMYYIGHKEGEDSEKDFLRELRDIAGKR